MKPSLSIAALFFLLLSLSMLSCKPEKVKPTEPTKEVSKYDLIPGNYKMYDTLGNYLYDLNIKHFREETTNPVPKDSLLFTNFDGKYTFKTIQSSITPINYPKYSFSLGFNDLIFDSNGKRVALYGYESYFNNDSIYLYFEVINIKYYISDMVPYFSKKEKQIGVKQH